MHLKYLYLLLALIALIPQASIINTITPNSSTVNAVTNYTWNLIFNSNTSRVTLNLTFPTQCVLSANTSAWINSTQLNHSFSGNVLTISSTLLFGNIAIVVRNVKNPNSAIITNSFSAQSSLDGSLAYGSTVSYFPGVLQSSTWSFSLCTEQPDSVLTVNVMTTNIIPMGNSVF